jgi:hypothetical protein
MTHINRAGFEIVSDVLEILHHTQRVAAGESGKTRRSVITTLWHTIRKTAPPIAACSIDADAMRTAAAKQVSTDSLLPAWPIHTLSKKEPRKVQGSVAGPPISIAATPMPAGGKIGDA